MQLNGVLILDRCKTGRESLEALMGCHCEQVWTAGEPREALGLLADHPDVSVLLAAVDLPDPEAEELLAAIAALPEATRPRVLILSSTDEVSLRSTDLGVDGYLTKPIMYRDVSRALRRAEGIFARTAVRIRSRRVGTAFLLAEGDADQRREAQVGWEIDDLSMTGAFLETRGPLPVGSELEIALLVDEQRFQARARVVRVQEPSWGHVAGESA